jgi:hypothetical protein
MVAYTALVEAISYKHSAVSKEQIRIGQSAVQDETACRTLKGFNPLPTELPGLTIRGRSMYKLFRLKEI